jgi:hypothetical protein
MPLKVLVTDPNLWVYLLVLSSGKVLGLESYVNETEAQGRSHGRVQRTSTRGQMVSATEVQESWEVRDIYCGSSRGNGIVSSS